MPKIIFMPHANIQYLQLAPEKRLWVMENYSDFYYPDNDSVKRKTILCRTITVEKAVKYQ